MILPGSKHVAADLAWLRAQGFDAARASVPARARHLRRAAAARRRDRGSRRRRRQRRTASGCSRSARRFGAAKTTRHTTARFGELAAPWSALSGLEVSGYEIRHGHTTGEAVLGDGLAFVDGPALGVYLHGLFEQPDFAEALLGRAPDRSLDARLDELADAVEPHLDPDALLEVLHDRS